MKIQQYLAIGAVSLGTFTYMNSASAALVQVGTFDISGNLDAVALGALFDDNNPTSFLTTLDWSDASSEELAGTGEFNFLDADGVFMEFDPLPTQFGSIVDLPVDGEFFPVNDFLTFAINPQQLGGGGNPTVTFDLENIVGFDLNDTNLGFSAALSVTGTFDTPTGTYIGEGTLSAQQDFAEIPGIDNFDDLLAFLAVPGNSISDIGYSANFVAFEDVPNGNIPVTPEASNIIGLLTLGLLGGTVVARKQRK